MAHVDRKEKNGFCVPVHAKSGRIQPARHMKGLGNSFVNSVTLVDSFSPPKKCHTKLLDLNFIFGLSVHVWVGEFICKLIS